MASTSANRVLVHVRHSKSNFSRAIFKHCIFEQLGIEDKEQLTCKVTCHLESNNFYLELAKTQSNQDVLLANEVMLKHPPFCPVLDLSEEIENNLPSAILESGINVGVAVLLETSDEHVLMTRRSPHMRTFPGVWVPPGGHIEMGESLEEAGFRELEEETGLSISPNGVNGVIAASSDLLALWESVYPPILFRGHPKRHHIVVYLHIPINKTSLQMEKLLKLNFEEVDAAVWLPFKLVDSFLFGHRPTTTEQEKISCLVVDKSGVQTKEELDLNILKEKLPSPGQDIQRLSTGTRYAIEMWHRKKTSKPLSKSSNL